MSERVLKYFVVYRSDICVEIMERSVEQDPYRLTMNVAKTKVLVPVWSDNIPPCLFSQGADFILKDDLDAWVADPANGFTASEGEDYADEKNYTLDGVSKCFSDSSNGIQLCGVSKFAISMWLDFNFATDRTDYFWGYYIDNDTRLCFMRNASLVCLYNYDASSNTSQAYCYPTRTNGLHQLGVVYDPSEATKTDRVKIFFDGEFQAMTMSVQEVPTATYEFGGYDFYIGTDRASGGNFFYGAIREMAIWSGGVLDSDDIAAIYNSGVPCDIRSMEPDNYYWFGDSLTDDTTQVTDLMGNANLICNNIATGDINDN